MSRPVRLDELALAVADLIDRYDDHEWHGRGLIHQLADPAERTQPATEPGAGSRTKPGSRPPQGALEARDLLTEIETGVYQHDADLRDALDDHLDYERPWLQILDSLPGLAGRLPDPTRHELTAALASDVHRWVRRCRQTLGFADRPAPRTLTCPYCTEQSIVTVVDDGVRAWCRNPACADDQGERVRWNATTITLLLASQPQEAAS